MAHVDYTQSLDVNLDIEKLCAAFADMEWSLKCISVEMLIEILVLQETLSMSVKLDS